VLKYKYGMHPLTVTWPPILYTDVGLRNFRNWIEVGGFDNITFKPNGRVHRLLTRLAIENLLHPFQTFILGQKNLAPKMALKFGVPLVFYGENEAEHGNPIQDASRDTRDPSYFALDDVSEVYLGGVSLSELKASYGLIDNDLQPYLPAKLKELEKVGVRVYYLGYYLRWHPQSCYYYAVEHGDFQAAPERTPGTYSKYNSIDDRMDDFHYYTTYIKFGLGRASYEASQEIRSGDITRDEGVALVKRFDGEFPERFADEIFRYLSVTPKEFPIASHMFERPILTRESFDHLADRFRSPHLWRSDGDTWRLRQTVWQSD